MMRNSPAIALVWAWQVGVGNKGMIDSCTNALKQKNIL